MQTTAMKFIGGRYDGLTLSNLADGEQVARDLGYRIGITTTRGAGKGGHLAPVTYTKAWPA
jgi:hypothetical protein